MPRRPRINLAGHPQHVVQRGHNREACFFADEDYLFYLHWLREGSKKYGCDVHAYVHDQSCAPIVDASSPRCHLSPDAIPRQALCPVRELRLQTQRQCLGGAIQG